MKIIDKYESNGSAFYTVELEEDVFMDVKCVGDLSYVMSCEDGYNVYNSDGNTFDYYYNEDEVIEFVKNVNK